MDSHTSTIASLATSIATFHSQNLPWRVYHGGSNSTREPQYSRNAIVDTSSLTSILSIDREKMRALVEPNVSMGHLVEATFREGFVPQVVMEFPGITVGGGFSGNSGESSSWRYGLFDETVTSIEIILADGTITHASPMVNADLYHGAAGGHGTLGLVTALEVQLIPAKQYIQIDCFQVDNTVEANRKMQRLFDANEHFYIDGILIGPNSGVIMAGRPVDAPSTTPSRSPNSPLTPTPPIVRFDRAHDQWFYRYIEKRLSSLPRPSSSTHSTSTSPAFTFLTPTPSYLFRYDRGAFWGGKFAFSYLCTPFNRLTRFLLDPFLHSSTMFHALHGSGLAGQTYVQDIGVPMPNLPNFMEYLGRKLGFEYWWLCPVRKRRGKAISFAMVSKAKRGKVSVSGEDGNESQDDEKEDEDQKDDEDEDEMWIDVGIWGRGPKSAALFAQGNRELEAKTHELGGLKALYARTYYTEEEFWRIYDREAYETLRRKYGATGLPSLYDKVKAEPRDEVREEGCWRKMKMMRPLPGIWGILSLVRGEYLLRK